MNRPSVQPSQPARIVVVGGGFSGAMSAVSIARLSEQPLQITVINDLSPVGRGVAYGLRLRTRSEFESTPEIELRERFVPRQIYGDYLRSIVQHHL